ncbi:hypothetical protein EYR41_005347 [Orbilia oligospora]|uniref:glucan endo-1,3-beta-D-glucosidase n=1 Tax=Orbilia oligospora TaxID=2813651 RepID=A0A8H2DYF9_ORBOL|nr:hypothetical protein TWF132_010033 [Orbilia oligospora]TGJ69295.1 hypothetical protein EYR41_005347 [Orbilia oligospora]
MLFLKAITGLPVLATFLTMGLAHPVNVEIEARSLKSSPFNPSIPVPEVAPPLLPSNLTVPTMDGNELRARGTVHRPTVGYFAGFNVGAYTNTGACKTLQDWRNELKQVKACRSSHFSFTVVKIFTTSQCSALKNALQAAKEVGGIKVWAGLWATPRTTFDSDKNELGRQILGSNGNLILGVSVGSEELFRGSLSSGQLAGYIWDVKGMIQNSYGKTNVPIGTSEGIAPLLNPANQQVLDASDAVLLTSYPYYGGSRVDLALKAFQQGWWALGAKMAGKTLIVGETGWPSKGKTIGQAVPTVPNARQYFKAIACWMRTTGKPFFWFSAVDEQWKSGGVAETRFGVSWTNGVRKYTLSC